MRSARRTKKSRDASASAMFSSLPCCVRNPPSAFEVEPAGTGAGSNKTTSLRPRFASAHASDDAAVPAPRIATKVAPLHHPDQAAAEDRDQLSRAIDVVVADGQEVDPRRPLGVGRDHRAGG